MSRDDQDLLLERMTWNEVQTALDDHRSLIIPIGAIEQHGPHLPLGTNAIVAFELARRVARRHGSVVAPAMCYSAQSSTRSGGGRSFPSFTFVTGQILIGFVRDVTSEFFRIGFRQVAYLNGHYEDSSLVHEVLTEAMAPYDKTCKAIMVNWWEQIRPEDIEDVFNENFPGWKAGYVGMAETSLMQELRPELIPLYGVPSRPDLASLQLGRYLVRTLIDRISAILARELPGPAALRNRPGSRKLQQTQRRYTTTEVKAAVD